MEAIEPDGENSEPVAEPKEKAPAETERPLTAIREEIHRVRPSFWRGLIGVLAVLIIAFLLILLARWIYHATHHHSKNVSSTSQEAPANSSQNKSPSGQNSTGNNSSSNSSSSPSSNNSQITNTGPGDTVAIFVVASVVAGGAHYMVRRRQTN